MLGRKLALPVVVLAATLTAACSSASQVALSPNSSGTPSSQSVENSSTSSSPESTTVPSEDSSSAPSPEGTSGTSSPSPSSSLQPVVDEEALRSQTLPVALKVLEFAVASSRESRGIDVSDPDPGVYSALRKSSSAWIGAARQAQKDLPDPVESVLLDGTPLTRIKAADVSPRDGVTVAVMAAGTMCSIKAVPLPEAAAWAWEGPECASVAVSAP